MKLTSDFLSTNLSEAIKRNTLVAMIAGLSSSAFAAPMAPDQRSAPGSYSEQVLQSFNLLADSDDSKLVYYIPLSGGISVKAASSADPRPSFAVSSRIPSFGFWAGEELVYFGGSWDTTGHTGDLKKLEEETRKQGLKIAPAPVKSAKSVFMATAEKIEGDRVEVTCDKELMTITTARGTRDVPIVKCKVLGSEGEYSGTNLVYKYANLPVSSGVISQRIPFQVVTLPDWTSVIESKLNSYAAWSDLLTGKIEWTVEGSSRTRQARAIIQWEQLFEQASLFAAYHDYACIDVEINGFFQKLAGCDDPTKCGVKMEFLQEDGRTWGDKAPDNADFVNAVNSLQKDLETELFNEVAEMSRSELGRVSQRQSSLFTLRANYEKRILEKRETRYFNYNQGPSDVTVSTDLQIDCIGGNINQRIFWDTESPGCAAILGQ